MNVYSLIADGGSTKTDWLLQLNGNTIARHNTQGINPFMLDQANIEQILNNELLNQPLMDKVSDIQFYGAGCRGLGIESLHSIFQKLFPLATNIIVESDLIGAAKALYNHSNGIACILGTGCNSGLYINGQITQNTPPLGYILGDEGSGASLGKRLIGDIIKHQLPESICEQFWDTCPLNTDQLIERIYRRPLANRFLASFAPFLHTHRHEKAIRQLLHNEFTRFFVRNIHPYHRNDLPVSFVGSIAFYFKNEIQHAAHQCGYTLGTIIRQPLDAY